jgi:superfamily II DNA/RNA helicase
MQSSYGQSAKTITQANTESLTFLENSNIPAKPLTPQVKKKVLIFGETKHGVERLTDALVQKGHKAESIHGDKSQYRRQQALHYFKKKIVNILVATDVAARGLDIPNVTHVINYDIPKTYEDYVHRIGRTGRANKKGIALTFVR